MMRSTRMRVPEPLLVVIADLGMVVLPEHLLQTWDHGLPDNLLACESGRVLVDFRLELRRRCRGIGIVPRRAVRRGFAVR